MLYFSANYEAVNCKNVNISGIPGTDIDEDIDEGSLLKLTIVVLLKGTLNTMHKKVENVCNKSILRHAYYYPTKLNSKKVFL